MKSFVKQIVRALLSGLIGGVRFIAVLPGIISLVLPPTGFSILVFAAQARAESASSVEASTMAADVSQVKPLPIKRDHPKATEFLRSTDKRVKAHGGRISLRHLDLTRPPTEEELCQSGQLGSRLSPTHSADSTKIHDRKKRKAQEEDNLLFGKAMQKWNEHHYDDAVQILQKHRQDFPDSPWAGEAQLHLGCQAQFSGNWEGAKFSFEWILGNLEKGSDIWQKAKLRRGVLYFEQGELEKASAAFSEQLKTEKSWERKTYAQAWFIKLNQVKSQQIALRVCGRDSIACVLEERGDKDGAETARKELAPSERGFSLGELQQFARQMSLPATAVRVDPSSVVRLAFPFVAHYKDEHFVTVTGIDGSGGVKIFDSRLGRTTLLTPDQFAAQWSGLALIFDKIPEGVRLASTTELDQEIGGCCGLPRPPSKKGDCDKPEGSGGGAGDCAGCGEGPSSEYGYAMPVWQVNPVNLNIIVNDIPIWIKPPIGPRMEIRLTYNSQDSLNQYRPFGNKWSFNYTSTAVESPAQGGDGSVLITMPNGREDVFAPLQNGLYTSPSGVFNQLTKTAPYTWQLTFPDGTIYSYGIPSTMSGSSATSLLLSITDKQGFSTTMGYDEDGKIQSVQDAQGHEFAFSYNTAGYVSRVDDSFGRNATFTYDETGNLVAQTDMGGLSYGYNYDADVYLKNIYKPSGTWEFYVEPAQDAISNGSNPYPAPGGAMWSNYRITVTNPLGLKEEYYFNGYSAYGWHRNPVQYRSTLAALNAPKTKYYYTTIGGEGVVRQTVDANGISRTEGNYNANRQPGSISDENGHTEYLTYNAQGSVLTRRNARGYTTTYEYETNGNDVKRVKDNSGLVLTEYTYDGNGNRLTTTNALNQTVTNTYNQYGQLETVTLPDSTVQSYVYNAQHQLTSIMQGTTVFSQFTYDAIGRKATETDRKGQTRAFEYDGLNRLTRIVYPDGTAEESQWGCCKIERQTDRNGLSTQMVYNEAGRLIVKRDPQGTLTQFRYDPNGKLLQLIDGRGTATNWAYDIMGRVSSKTFADGATHRYTYDNVGNLLTETDPMGHTTTYTYDANNNLASVVTQGVATVTFTYDESDRRKTLTDGIGTTTWSYDVAGRPIGLSLVASGNAWTDTVSFGYDTQGRLNSRTANGASSTVHYDSIGRLDWKDTQAGRYLYAYSDAVSTKLASVTYPNGQITTYGYETANANQRLQTIWNKVGSAETDPTLSRFDYQYSAAGQINRWQQQSGAVTPSAYDFENDVTGQLTGAVLMTGTIPKTYRYSYDPAGNRTSETIDSAVTQDVHNNINQLTQRTSGGAIPFGGSSDVPLSSVTVNENPAVISGGTNFTGLANVVSGSNTVTVVAKDQSNPPNVTTNNYGVTVASGTATVVTLNYDLNGNILGDGTRTFEWDARNRLTAVNKGTHRTEFAYNGLSQRVRVIEKENGTIQSNKRLVWVDTQIVEERDGVTNALNKRYNLYEMVVAAGTNAGTYFYTRDHLGSVRELTDASKTVRARYVYDPHGRRSTNQITLNAVEADFGFTGHYLNAPTGLNLAFYRAYDADLGRWLSRDPLPNAEMRQGPNLYAYVWNRPINSVDPLGLDVWVENTNAIFGLHKRVCVTTWDKCCKNRTGKYCISFFNRERMSPGRILGVGRVEGDSDADGYWGEGSDYGFYHLQGCKDDKATLDWLKSLEGSTMSYVAGMQDCRTFSWETFSRSVNSDRF
jgi:RHS repeat-associated protein